MVKLVLDLSVFWAVLAAFGWGVIVGLAFRVPMLMISSIAFAGLSTVAMALRSDGALAALAAIAAGLTAMQVGFLLGSVLRLGGWYRKRSSAVRESDPSGDKH